MAKLSIITDPVTKQQFSRDTNVAGSIYAPYTAPAAATPQAPAPTVAPAAAPIAPPIAAPAPAPTQTPAPTAIGAPTAPPAPTQTVDPKQLAASTNQEAQGIYDQTKNQDINIRNSQKVIRDLTEKVTGGAGAAPKPPSLMDMYIQQRQQLGLDPLQNQLTSLDNQINQLQTGALVTNDRTSEAPLSMQAIGNKQGATSREAQRQIALLSVQRQAIAAQVDNKLATLQMVMNFGQQDYANASQAYGQEFDRNMQTLNLLSSQQDKEQTAQDRLQQNATANLQTIWNTMKDSGASFDTLSDSQRASINQMELQAGLPTGFFESLPAFVPEQKILSTTTRDNGGVKYADVLTQDPKSGTISVQSVALGSTGASGGGAGGSYAAAAGYNGDFAATINNVANLEKTVAGKKAVQSNLQSYIAAGDYKSAYNQIANSVEDQLVGESKQRFANARTDAEVMQGMKNAIQQYADAGGDTNLLKGSAESIYNKLGAVKDPKFKSVAVALQREFQTYRNTMTGAAFSPQESAEYQSVNPTANNTLNLNLSVIDGALSQLNNRVNSTIKSRAGDGAVYIKEYAEGAQSQTPASEGAAAPDNEYLKWLQANGLTHN
jgi:hypothetical protein